MRCRDKKGIGPSNNPWGINELLKLFASNILYSFETFVICSTQDNCPSIRVCKSGNEFCKRGFRPFRQG